MTRHAMVTGIVSLLAALSVVPLAAQSGAHVGVAPIIPVRELGEYADPGYMIMAGVHRDIGGNPLLAGHVTAFFGSVSHNDVDGDATRIPGIGVGGRYRFSAGPTKPYGGVAVGALQHRYVSEMFEEGSETKPFVSAGGGVETVLGGLGVFADARLTLADGTSFLGFFFGGVMRLGAGAP